MLAAAWITMPVLDGSGTALRFPRSKKKPRGHARFLESRLTGLRF